MKTLHLIRHAKSSWADSSLADIDRPLNKRGVKACRIMAPKIREAGCGFENVFCSPAARAQATIQGIAETLPPLEIRWEVEEDLYTFIGEDLMLWCRDLEDVLDNAVLIGHNPAMTDFCNELTLGNLANLPTCGYVRLDCDVNSWGFLEPGVADLTVLLKPKMFD